MKKCKHPDCNGDFYSLGYCRKHYRQIAKYGEIKSRIMTDPNIFVFADNSVYISMFNRGGEPTDVAVVDVSDFDLVKHYKWSVKYSKRIKYAMAYINGRMVALHRHLMNLGGTKPFVDHIDHNGLNCKRENIRLVTPGQNTYNRRSNNNKKHTKYKGVYWHVRDKIWWSYITANGKRTYIGKFNTEKEAALAYNKKAKQLHGEYANLNKLERGDK